MCIKSFTKWAGAAMAAAVFCIAVSGCGNDDGDDGSGFVPGSQFNPNITYGEFTDLRDGKIYKSVTIGSQTWMAENLNYKTNDSWCYDNDDANCNKYGRLYDWNTAMSICPTGWRLPLDAEWHVLMDYAGGSGTAGMWLKSQSVDSSSTDKYGFSALMGGWGWGNDDGFLGADWYGAWWSDTEGYSVVSAYGWEMFKIGANAGRDDFGKGCLFSVRCVSSWY